MASSKDYIEQVKNIGIDGFKISAKTIDEAAESIAICNNLEGKLSHIKNAIAIEIDLIKEKYDQRITDYKLAKTQKKSLFSFGQGQNAGSDEEESEERLIKERDIFIKSYTLVVDYIDNFLTQIDNGKKQLSNYITEINQETSS